MKKLKIALLAPLTRPPHQDTRGSRPRIVYDLAKFLQQFGHDVTVYAAGDAEVPTNLVKVLPQSIYNSPAFENPFYAHTIALSELALKIKQDAPKYDIIHNHVYPEFIPLLVSGEIKTPILTTPHLYMWPEYLEILKKFSNTYFASIANYQQKKGEGINWVGNVYNGIDTDEFEFNDKPEDYFLFFGRIKKDDPKGVRDAIKVCKLANVKLKIAGNVEDVKFFEECIKSELNEKIEFIGDIDAAGPIGFREKVELYKNAKGYFFLSHWDEGCPLGPLEAMACGTPVIANRRSSLPEIVVDGKTGFIVSENDLDATVNAIKNIDQIKREDCRAHIENNFTAKKMAENYVKIYEKLVN